MEMTAKLKIIAGQDTTDDSKNHLKIFEDNVTRFVQDPKIYVIKTEFNTIRSGSEVAWLYAFIWYEQVFGETEDARGVQ